MLDENNPFNNKIKTEDIYIEDNLFNDTDSKDKKKSFISLSNIVKIYLKKTSATQQAAKKIEKYIEI